MTSLAHGDMAGMQEPLHLTAGSQLPVIVATGETDLLNFCLFDFCIVNCQAYKEENWKPRQDESPYRVH